VPLVTACTLLPAAPPKDVKGLPFGILLPMNISHACPYRLLRWPLRRRAARARFGYDTRFPHFFSEKDLPKHVVFLCEPCGSNLTL
jgi:hypothetical protein